MFWKRNRKPLWAPAGEGEGAPVAEAEPDLTVQADPAATPETPAEEAPQEEPKAAAPEESKPAPKPDWRDKRIAKLTAQLKEAQAKPKAPEAPAPQQNPTEDFNRRVSEAVAAQRFNEKCNEVAEQGRSAFPDFDERLTALRSLVNDQDPAEVAQYNQFIQAGMETGQLHQIIHELGADLEEASRLLALPPIKMAMELAKRGVAPQADPVSLAPKPIRPLGGQLREHTQVRPDDPSRSDTLSTAEWMKRRSEQVAGRR